MNNDIFKQFVVPFVTDAIEVLGGIDRVRAQHEQWPLLSFVAGYVCASINHEQGDNYFADWRDSPEGFDKLNQEEIRRVFDVVRLRLETESTTS